MKCVILGNTKLNYSWFVLTYRQGLKLNGIETRDIDYKSNKLGVIKNKLLEYKPEYVFTHLSFHAQVNPISKVLQMYEDVYKQVGTKFIHTLNDARRHDRYMEDISHAFHCAFVGNYEVLENAQKAWNIPVFFAPYSSMTYHDMADVMPVLRFKEAVFTGSPGSHKDRADFIKKLQKYMKLKIFQTQSSEDMRKHTPQLSASAWAILGLCTGYDIDGYIDVRPFQYMGTGAVMISRKFKGMDDIIPPDLYYPFSTYDEKDAKRVADIYRNKCFRKENNKMRKKAFKYIQQNHSSSVRLKQIISECRSI